MIERWSWRELAGTLALATCAVAGASAFQQAPPPLPVTRLDERAPAADLDGPRTVTLSLSQPLPLRDLLLLLVRGTPFSVVTDDRVDGTFAGELKDLTMRQALEAVLFPREFDYDLQGTLIRVYPRKPATRVYDINYVNVARTADLFDELEKGVERLLSPTGRAHVDRGAGLVQVTDFAERLDEIGVYVEAVQLRATRQVRLEARVFEVTFHDAATRSIDWRDIVARSPAAVQPSAPGAAGVRIVDFNALLSTFAALGRVRLIAAPRILASNNEPALMRIGTEIVYFVPIGDGRAATPTTTMEGLTLQVTAQIAADGIVQLHVAPTYKEKTADAKGPRGVTAPVLGVAEADTVARVRDGDTVIVSGFLKDRTRTAPGTGLAGFFGAQTHEAVTSELVILLTPTVVAPGPGISATAK